MACEGCKILLTWRLEDLRILPDFQADYGLWRARRELNPGQPGVFREVKASPEMDSSGALPLQDPLFGNLAELRARATAESDLIYIS